MHLWHAAHRVGVLDARVSDAVRGDVRAAGHERAQVAGDGLLSGMRPARVQLLVPRAVGPAQGLGGHRADDVGRRREDLRVVEREAPDGGHHLRAVDERHALLRSELEGLEARGTEGLSAGAPLRPLDGLAFADEHERGVRERREVARRADAAVHRDVRMHAAVEHVAEEIDDVRSHAGSPRREGVRPEQQDRAHDVLRERRADADGVAADEVALKRAELVVRDPHGGKVAEPGVHAVHRLVPAGHLRDDLGRLLDRALRGAVETDRDVLARDRDDVGDRKVVAGEPEGRYRKFSRYQRPRSV